MRLLANENFPGEAVGALRSQGHDVVWVRVDQPGASDEDVISRAGREGRILLTFDKGFGELAFKAGLAAPSGIILFRIQPQSPAHITRIAVAALASRADWSGQFAVIEEGRIRMTPIPGSE